MKVRRYPTEIDTPHEFIIKNQGAANNCRFYVYEDIQRMEKKLLKKRANIMQWNLMRNIKNATQKIL